jgi:hypothetical protein
MISRCPPPTPTPTPTPTSTVTVADWCPLKLTPINIANLIKIGNDGQNFPLRTTCKIAQQQDCYLAYELGNDPGTDSPITKEDLGLISAPCLNGAGATFCWLAIEEDGDTPFELEENSDFFLVQCVKT